MEQIIANLLNDFERGRMSRRQLVQTLAAGIAAATATTTSALAAGPTKLKAISVNHYVMAVPDYAKTRDFYADLLGMKVSEDTGKQCYLGFGDTLLTARTSPLPGGKPYITHVGYTLDDWNADAVEAELNRRGLEPRTDMGGGAKSFHIKDLDGYDVQVGPPLKKV